MRNIIPTYTITCDYGFKPAGGKYM